MEVTRANVFRCFRFSRAVAGLCEEGVEGRRGPLQDLPEEVHQVQPHHRGTPAPQHVRWKQAVRRVCAETRQLVPNTL